MKKTLFKNRAPHSGAKVKKRTSFSSPRAKKGKLAFRTPSRFVYQKYQQVSKWKIKKKK